MELGGAGPRERPPALDGAGEQRADVDRDEPVLPPAAAARRLEVVECEPGPPQLELHRREPPGARAGHGRDAVEAEERRLQRPAQLVGGLGDEREPRPQPPGHDERQPGRSRRDDPGDAHRPASSPSAAAVAAAASSSTLPSRSR